MTPQPSARPFIRQRATGPFWYAKWSRQGQAVVRALGRAWVESDGEGGWRRKRGRPPESVLTEVMAAGRMLVLVREHDAEQELFERDADERRRRGVTFRELAAEYLQWLEAVHGAKPSTLRDHRLLLAEPGAVHRRGAGERVKSRSLAKRLQRWSACAGVVSSPVRTTTCSRIGSVAVSTLRRSGAGSNAPATPLASSA